MNITNTFKAFINIPKNLIVIYRAMQSADHIHIRCPGNIGLLACIIQLFFPHKPKTAKYAGNWDPKSNQPKSYNFQKWILSNKLLTRNIQVLVYGDWENQSINIKPFFTATYSESEKNDWVINKPVSTTVFLFVGTLTSGKRPIYAIQLVEKLLQIHKNIKLDIFGEGSEKQSLMNYIQSRNLTNYIELKGNQSKESLKKAYQNAHFIILPSKSEGWPKAIAEGMFWGCLPIATDVSCVKNMVDNENRGIIIDMNLENDVDKINFIINNADIYHQKTNKSLGWSRRFTIDFFETEIKKLLAN